MKLSVALASYNGAEFIGQQLRSIAEQTRPPDELVVADDGSTDTTIRIVEEFSRTAAFRVVIDAHGLRLGFNENFARAIGQCTGDVVALSDQDDVWLPGKLGTCLTEFADPSVMGVAHGIRLVDRELKPLGLELQTDMGRTDCNVFTCDPLFTIAGMSLLFRREQLAPWLASQRPESKWWPIPAVFDEFLFFLATICGRVILLPEVYVLWRRHEAAASSVESGHTVAQAHAPAYQRSLAWGAGSSGYTRMADVASTRAAFAQRMLNEPLNGAAIPVAGAVEHYLRFERTYRRRSRLYSPDRSRPGRIASLVAMALGGEYRGRTYGGLGMKSLLKDGYQTMFGLRKNTPTPHSDGRSDG